MKGNNPMAHAENPKSTHIRFKMEVNGFLVKIAETKQEIRAAQRLRFEVFNLEMNEGLSSSWESGLDQDQYDEHADHLIVVNRKSDEVVGTYRILTKSTVIRREGKTGQTRRWPGEAKGPKRKGETPLPGESGGSGRQGLVRRSKYAGRNPGF